MLVASPTSAGDQVHARLRVAIDTRPGTAGFAASAAEDPYAVSEHRRRGSLKRTRGDRRRRLRVLAFSNLPGSSTTCAPGRSSRACRPRTSWCGCATGTAVRIRHTDNAGPDPPGNRCRLVMPVRAGITVGWVAEGDEPLGPRHAWLLVEVAWPPGPT
ncbi:hypothetical protein HBB16_06510 [Pseudonocardia sp. MCCB 268]|nr:hypothetical protein [Pseudonocardia cytotoxica]